MLPKILCQQPKKEILLLYSASEENFIFWSLLQPTGLWIQTFETSEPDQNIPLLLIQLNNYMGSATFWTFESSIFKGDVLVLSHAQSDEKQLFNLFIMESAMYRAFHKKLTFSFLYPLLKNLQSPK